MRLHYTAVLIVGVVSACAASGPKFSGQKHFFRLWSGDYEFNASGSIYHTSKTVTIAQVDETAALAELKDLRLSQ